MFLKFAVNDEKFQVNIGSGAHTFRLDPLCPTICAAEIFDEYEKKIKWQGSDCNLATSAT